VTDRVSIAEAAERIRKEFGRLDLLINNAPCSNTRKGSLSLPQYAKISRPSNVSLDEVRVVSTGKSACVRRFRRHVEFNDVPVKQHYRSQRPCHSKIVSRRFIRRRPPWRANDRKKSMPEPLIVKSRQETLAEIVGTMGSRVAYPSGWDSFTT
jgi:hypothetical protein